MPPSIFDYIISEKNKFETDRIQLGDNWEWNFREHVQLIFHLKNGVFFTGANDYLRTFKAVLEPVLELASWTEDLEVKDVTFYIESDQGKALSFLIKKYHDEVYVKEHNLDTLFDKITDSDLTYGGVLVQKGKEPEVLELNCVAFCDQTDILGGAIGFQFYFNPSKLRSMSSYGWGEESNGATISLEELCTLASSDKDAIGTLNENKNQTPTKAIEVYIVRGDLPEHYLEDNDDMEYYCNQLHIVAFYTDKEGKKKGVTLYRKREDIGNLKFFTSKEVFQRALGRGIGERLIHPQIWTNFLTIHKTNMLEAGSKVPLYTDDTSYTQKNRIQDMENLEITTIAEGAEIRQVPTVAPANIQLFSNEINAWYEQAQSDGSAQDPLLGKESSSGTTFRGQERLVAQGRGAHDKRRGQRSKFIEEIYRDWIIPDIKKEILKGKKFLSTLSTEELTWIADQMAENLANEKIKELLLSGKVVTTEEQQQLKNSYKEVILKKGNKQLIEILKQEFENIEIKMGINIAGKQKNLVELSDKYLSIFEMAINDPVKFQQSMQIPYMAKMFEKLLEFGGMSIGDFSSLLKAPVAMESSVVEEPAQATPELALTSTANE